MVEKMNSTTNNDIFDGLGINFGFADSNVANPTATRTTLNAALPESYGVKNSHVDALVDVENENNKRVRINKNKHKRVHSDPNVFSQFVAQQQSQATTSFTPPPKHHDRVDLRDYGMNPTSSIHFHRFRGSHLVLFLLPFVRLHHQRSCSWDRHSPGALPEKR